MQEIKCKPEQFPYEPFADAGYEIELHGLNQWNGVAFASRLPMTDVTVGFPDAPGFGKVDDAGDLPQEARALGVTVDDIRLWSLYVPNGREFDNPHYPYKLEWLARLQRCDHGLARGRPEAQASRSWATSTSHRSTPMSGTSRPSRAGPTSASPSATRSPRSRPPASPMCCASRGVEGYTYWDYQQLRFPRNEGMRIDFILGSKSFTDAVTDAKIERNERKGEAPSDHVPLVVDLDIDVAEDDDDRPMIF